MKSSSLQFPSAWVVIAAYNEGGAIEQVLSELNGVANIVVVDDCSRDDTAQAVRRQLSSVSSLFLVQHAVNLGQGAALQTGIRFALRRGGEYFVTFDADGQHSRESIAPLLAPLQASAADVALGSRFRDGGEANNISSVKKNFLWCATQFTRLLTQLEITDTHNGLRAFTRKAASQFSITQNRMAHATQFLVQIRRHKMPYVEIPVKIRYTQYSVAKGQKMSNAVNIIWESFTELFWH